MSRCQVQYLHRGAWLDCARRTKLAVAVGGTYRDVCAAHREEVRRVERVGLAAGLRWSEQPTPPRRPPSNPDQTQLLDVAARQRPRRWSA